MPVNVPSVEKPSGIARGLLDIRNKLERNHIPVYGVRKPFSTDLSKHQRSHTGEKPHQCNKHGKTIRNHVWSHVKGCTLGRNLTQRFTVGKVSARHQVLLCIRESTLERKTHKCIECGKALCKSSNLTTHRNIHIREALYMRLVWENLLVDCRCHQTSDCSHWINTLVMQTVWEMLFVQVGIMLPISAHTGERSYDCVFITSCKCKEASHWSRDLSKHQRVSTLYRETFSVPFMWESFQPELKPY